MRESHGKVARVSAEEEKTILDVACGKGATTRYLLRYFKSENVTGINISEKQLARCRENAPGCTFLLMSATELKFADESFDNISCVEAAFHFVTREKFLKEAFRMLKPRGQIVLRDVLSAKHREEHGQHPQMYGLPETQLFATESLAARSPGNPQKAVRCRHGLIRAVAELYFGEQTEKSVRQAGGWLGRGFTSTPAFFSSCSPGGCIRECRSKKTRMWFIK